MTDQERVEKTYSFIREKYPSVTRKEEIDDLAIKHDRKRLLLESLGWLLGALVSLILFLLLRGNETYESTCYLALIMTVSFAVESVKSFWKRTKVVYRYRPVLKVRQEGVLTKDIILRDGKHVLKKANYIYEIQKLQLADKEDEVEIGVDNTTYHTYHLYFEVGEYRTKQAFKVKKNVYMEAVVGAEYLVVLTLDSEIACVYQATNWIVADDLVVRRNKDTISPAAELPNAQSKEPVDGLYQPNVLVERVTPRKIKKTLPIVALVLGVVSWFLPIIIGVPAGLAAIIVAIVSIVQQRSKLSVAAMIVNVLSFGILILSVYAMVTEAIQTMA